MILESAHYVRLSAPDLSKLPLGTHVFMQQEGLMLTVARLIDAQPTKQIPNPDYIEFDEDGPETVTVVDRDASPVRSLRVMGLGPALRVDAMGDDVRFWLIARPKDAAEDPA